MPVAVYLDTSVYNRPFDDQTQPRIWMETLALSVILQDVFVTCDDRLIRRYMRRTDHTLRAIDPIGFVREWSSQQGVDEE